MRFNKILFASALALLSLSVSSCYEKFETPSPKPVYTSEDFADMDHLTIKEVKDLFYAEYTMGSTGVGKSLTLDEAFWQGKDMADTKHYISGKVISSDVEGNVYKTLYIQDETAAIEIKLGKTNITNEMRPGMRVFVKIDDLCIGSYRYMLSLGLTPSEDDIANKYANSNMDLQEIINAHVFVGEMEGLTAADTLVVSEGNQLTDYDLGRLVRFEKLTSTYGRYKGDYGEGYSSSDVYPSYLESKTDESGEDVYNNWTYDQVITAWKEYYKADSVYKIEMENYAKLIEEWRKELETNPSAVMPIAPNMPAVPKYDEPSTLEYPTWAFNNGLQRYYGSALFLLGAEEYPYVVRSSGYAKFAQRELTPDGKSIQLTALYCKYCSSSGGYVKYQLLVNKWADIVPLDY